MQFNRRPELREKFQALAGALKSSDAELGKFYESLVESEGNHYATYLLMAKEINESETNRRLSFYLDLDAELVRRRTHCPSCIEEQPSTFLGILAVDSRTTVSRGRAGARLRAP